MEDSLYKQELISSIIEYFDKLESNIPNKLSDLREGSEGEELASLLEGISHCFKGILLTQEFHNIKIDQEFLKDKTKEILDAFENQDYSLIGDVIEYEILEEIVNINTELKKL